MLERLVRPRALWAVLGVVVLVAGAVFGAYELARPKTTPRPSALFDWTARYASFPVAVGLDLELLAKTSTPVGIIASCPQLRSDLTNLQQVPPIPDATLLNSWRVAIGVSHSVLKECEAASSSHFDPQIPLLALRAEKDLGKVLVVLDNLHN